MLWLIIYLYEVSNPNSQFPTSSFWSQGWEHDWFYESGVDGDLWESSEKCFLITWIFSGACRNCQLFSETQHACIIFGDWSLLFSPTNLLSCGWMMGLGTSTTHPFHNLILLLHYNFCIVLYPFILTTSKRWTFLVWNGEDREVSSHRVH